MRSRTVTISGGGLGINDAMALTEQTAADKELTHKQALHLRLLSEELFGMLRGIAGDVQAEFWIEAEGTAFELHMKSDIQLTDAMKDQLIAASTSGRNDAAKGFMGRLRVFIAESLAPTGTAGEMLPLALMNAASTMPLGASAHMGTTIWSMEQYRIDVESHMNGNERVTEAWDELEKSIVANIADEVKVRIIGTSVEIIIFKKF